MSILGLTIDYIHHHTGGLEKSIKSVPSPSSIHHHTGGLEKYH
ncbi:hypothetical protein [uncultured Gammaproteobacteria bacterium]|nr:hypothetical protein [uncultured Gammaproteobacteria bacterium]